MKRMIAILLVISMLSACTAALAVPDLDHSGEFVTGFSSHLITGEPIDGSVFTEHRVSVVTYFATWSTQCRMQIEYLQQVHEAHPDYCVMGLLYQDATSTEAAALAFMQQNGYDIPVFVCDEVWSDIVEATPHIPQSFIINPEGMILESRIAPFASFEELEERLAFWYGVIPYGGDVDRDGEVTSTDALIVLRFALGIIGLTESEQLCADVNRDGALTTEDALLILRASLQLIEI